jgi:sugar phosphate isomerase/epimerase
VTWSIGIATGSWHDRPLLEVLDLLGGTGARGLEIGTPPRHFDLRQAADLGALAGALQRLGLAAVSIHAPFGHDVDLAHPDRHHREAGVEAVGRAASAIRRLGGSIVVAHPSDLPRAGADIGARLEAAVASLRQAAGACRAEGIRLAIESPLPHLIGGHPDEFGWILGHLDADTGVCLDTGHIALGRAWRRFVEVTGPRLLHVHASDNHGQYDDHLPPGMGTVDWGDVVGSLQAAGFAGWMMLELRCPSIDGEAYVRRALEQTTALCR